MSDQPGLVSGASWSAGPSGAAAAGTGEGFIGRYMPTAGTNFAALTSGSVSIAGTENTSTSAGVNNGTAERGVFDLTTLAVQVNVPANRNCLRFDTIFYSEEYPEYVGSDFNDAFIAELDQSTWTISGSDISAPDNFAFDEAGNALSVNSVSFSDASNTQLEYDGSTRLLGAASPVTPGQHTLYLSIFDAGDHVYDSAAFIDRLRASTETAASCAPGAALSDADGDGLLDSWEEDGLDVDGDDTIDVDLPAMGADPNHKDMFVELDTMPGTRLNPVALRLVANAFDKSPMTNPDGVNGVDLHVDAGPDSLLDFKSKATWGSLSKGGEEIPFQNVVGSFNGTNYNWSAFQTIKDSKFDSDREPVFRYALSINRFGSATNGSSGIARGLPGSDFLVSLGMTCNPEGSCGSGGPSGYLAQAGTFMHELGHTLSLRHGGHDHLHNKPNYLSVMNYLFQFDGMAAAPAVIDYSRFGTDVLPAIDENNVDEAQGYFAGSATTNYDTMIRCKPLFGKDYWNITPVFGPVDFDCDESTDDGVLDADLNNDGEKTTLYGANDWNRVQFKGGAVGGLGLAPLLPDETESDEEDVTALFEAAAASSPPPEPQTGAVTEIATTAAKLNGTVKAGDGAATWQFEYGTTEAFGQFTAGGEETSTTATSVSEAISGLNPATTYQYRLTARGPSSTVLYGQTGSFTTPAVSAPAGPGATTTSPGPAPEPPLTFASAVAPPPRPAKPKAALPRVASKSFSVDRQGRIKVVLECPKSASTICAGKLTLKFASKERVTPGQPKRQLTLLNGRSYVVGAGKKKGVTVTLSPDVRRALKLKRAIKLTASFSAPATATTIAATRAGSVTLKRR